MNINFFILQRILLWCHCCQKMRHIRHNVNHGKPMPRYCVSFQVHSRGLLWCLLMINPGPGINPICFAVNTTEHNCSPIFRSNKTTFLSSNKVNANNIFHIFLWTSTCCQIFVYFFLLNLSNFTSMTYVPRRRCLITISFNNVCALDE